MVQCMMPALDCWSSLSDIGGGNSEHAANIAALEVAREEEAGEHSRAGELRRPITTCVT